VTQEGSWTTKNPAINMMLDKPCEIVRTMELSHTIRAFDQDSIESIDLLISFCAPCQIVLIVTRPRTR
jgi:hypothetical protein